MNDEFSLLLWGALLALGGSLAQAFVGWSQTRSSRRQELLIEAYKEYLGGLAQNASNQSGDYLKSEAAMAVLLAGKQKIAAYGPASVVSALAAFERTSKRMSDEPAQAEMIKIIDAMRSSVGVRSIGAEEDVRLILFGDADGESNVPHSPAIDSSTVRSGNFAASFSSPPRAPINSRKVLRRMSSRRSSFEIAGC